MILSKSRRLLMFRIFLPLSALLFGLVFLETGLRFIERANAREQEAFSEEFLLKDPELHHRIAPNAPRHDANGFRNDAVPGRAEIVALGDSQTWGTNVQRSEAWPQVLGRLSNSTVYNMGVGGYGPLQYSALTTKALSFFPKTIVVGIYLGNDLYDVYSLAYGSEVYKDLRQPDASGDLLVDTILPRATALWEEEKNFQRDYGRSEPRLTGLWLSGHSAIGRLMVRFGWWPGSSDVWFEGSRAWAKVHPDHGAVYDAGGVRTVLTTAYRLTGLDLDDPHIAEGLRITGVALQRIKRQAEAAKVNVLVVLIPTKESVFASLDEKQQRDPVYERLYSMESRARTALIKQCENANIEYVDALTPLVRAVREGEQVYPTSTEGHPTAKGYRVIAVTVYDALNRLGW